MIFMLIDTPNHIIKRPTTSKPTIDENVKVVTILFSDTISFLKHNNFRYTFVISLLTKIHHKLMYSHWKNFENLPLECIVNMCLLFKGVRNIIQIDISYYDKQETLECINKFLEYYDQHIIKYRDVQENIIVYLKTNQAKLEKKLTTIGSGFIVNAFRNTKFADVLDPIFYQSKGKFPDIFNKHRIVQVSINVLNENSCGAILIQMCDVNINKHVKKLYKHFHYLSKCIEDIDSNLQTTLTFHTKPGLWKNSAELIARRYHQIDHV